MSMEELRLPELLDRIAERSGYGPDLRETPEGEERWSNVLELRRMATDYAEIETGVALELFLENVALVGGADTTQTSEDGKLIQEENKDAVTLITLHAAKGLEYPVVFIVGMDEGSLPHARSVDIPEQLEEERRLAYVGFTRAMRRLYLVRAYRRSSFGEAQVTEPSRFLEDIPLDLISSPGYGKATQVGGLRSIPGRRTSWEEDYNQDPYTPRESGRVYGSGKPGTPQWSSRPSTPPKAPPCRPRARAAVRSGQPCHLAHCHPPLRLHNPGSSNTNRVIGLATRYSAKGWCSKAKWKSRPSSSKCSSRVSMAKSA